MTSPRTALALVMLALATAVSAADEPQIEIAPRDGVLVLRNGYVLAGRITPQGDYYLVTFGDSGQARMPADQVEMVCRDVEQAYFAKRDRLNRNDVRAHLELADWCLRNQLPARAADQILCALALDPRQPRIAALRRRLQAGSRETGPQAAAAPSASTPVAAGPMDQRLSTLPPGAIERFTEKVQPVLLNGCATNACHGASSASELRLLRPRVGRPPSYRMTQRNLLQILQFVDRQQPQQSRLLSATAQPHGGLAGPVFAETEAHQLAALSDWVESLSGERRAASPPQLARPGGLLLQAGSAGSPRAPSGWELGRKTADAAAEEAVPNAAAPVSPSESPPPASAGRDAFDPEIFNQRYSGAR